ncbi:putative HOS3-like histone deacetylase [Clohesyomyces aquaticus]|uniref:Putative HOS3-like histone deacetylase n=1 Tax=Clohesyomyces aquaticus TaxID=1231657 RepID=A0A1Y1YV85_9PLEO|nr:putative HOS3-like histone deacetylase [Clohesyomyces aquaticus]
MQNHDRARLSPGDRSSPARRTSTNNDAHLLNNSLKRLSLHAAASTPLPQSPSLNSPRQRQRLPSSPGFGPESLRRSSSVASLNRSASPALVRKSSTSSLRGEMPGTPRASVSRRSSFNPNMPSPIGGKASLPEIEEKPPLRACDVAEEYFKRELAMHEGMAGAVTAGTIVIVHDQCYGHRFSRTKAPKGTLNLIVERPERILASVLGISTAYVRLGDRHAEGRNPPHPHRNPSERIPFKIRKTSRTVDVTSPVVTNVHGVKWMEELKAMCLSAEKKLATTGKELAREGLKVPGQLPKEAFHEGDLYLCGESLNAIQGALGGVLDAVDAVFQGTAMGSGPSRAFVSVRPPGHHCSADFPSGFCWVNNVHVGVEHAFAQYGLTHAAIIDFDLHHGDGSQSITWGRNKKVQNMPKNTPNSKKFSTGYFSLHDINSFPCEWGDDEKVQSASLCVDNAHGQSVWNIHLEGWKDLDDFWRIYEDKYLALLEKARKYLKYHTNRLRTSPNHPPPKGAIFLSAGFDASEWESAGMQRHGVNVPTDFYARFTKDVVQIAEEEGTGVEGRIISILEGGYSDRALTSGVLSHLSGLCDGQVFSNATPMNGLAQDMRRRFGGLSMAEEDVPMPSTEVEMNPVTYSPHWWHDSNLTELENLINPPSVIPQKKPRTGPTPTFYSPTQSFSAKVVDPSKLRTMGGKYASTSPSRAPTPPPPEVDWATAAQALSKLLIPSDRQTKSWTLEDLVGPTVKKEKPAPAPLPARTDTSGRQLRGRKPVTSYADPDSEEEKASARAASRANRRKTIADFQLAEPPVPARSVSRRMSIASSIGSVNGDRSASRASSVVPSRKSVTPAPGAVSNGVQVKKARGTSTTASRIPKNEPPVPRIPANYLKRTVSTASTKDTVEKENEVDQLTSGLKRITLKLPPKEEYEAREKQKALEAEKKAAATKTTTRKTPAARAPKTTTKPATKTATTKKAPARATKASKPSSPVGPAPLAPVNAITYPEPPQIKQAATPPLEQPQPVHSIQSMGMVPTMTTAERGASLEAIDPPTELAEMTIHPDQLPKPSFTTPVEPLPLTTPPPRPDTPPPPPPSNMPEFVNYGAHSFGVASSLNAGANQAHQHEPQAPLQWLPPNTDAALPSAALPTNTAAAVRPMTPSSKRQDLPVFTANGVIPFASNPNAAGNTVRGGEAKKNEEKDVWEVPETPAR